LPLPVPVGVTRVVTLTPVANPLIEMDLSGAIRIVTGGDVPIVVPSRLKVMGKFFGKFGDMFKVGNVKLGFGKVIWSRVVGQSVIVLSKALKLIEPNVVVPEALP
jgi:hypothetical protein